jgi:hypothetical protein
VKKALTVVGLFAGVGAGVVLLNLFVLLSFSAVVAWLVMLLLMLFDVSVGFLVTWAATTLVIVLLKFLSSVVRGK